MIRWIAPEAFALGQTSSTPLGHQPVGFDSRGAWQIHLHGVGVQPWATSPMTMSRSVTKMNLLSGSGASERLNVISLCLFYLGQFDDDQLCMPSQRQPYMPMSLGIA